MQRKRSIRVKKAEEPFVIDGQTYADMGKIQGAMYRRRQEWSAQMRETIARKVAEKNAR